MIPKRVLDGIYAHVCPHCGGFKALAAGNDMPDFDLEKEMERIVREVYLKKRRAGDTDKKLANKVAATVSQAVSQGYAKNMLETEWESPDWEMIRNLQKNVYQFSYAKNYEMMKATTMALFKDGKIIPFNEFKEIARRIGNEYNSNYLRTEYNTAIGSAQMASRWAQFQEEKKIFPNLTYRTVGDALVRPSHQLLDGITRPMNDSFWKSYYPPNGWGCRCDAEQSTSSHLTDPTTIVYPDDTPKIFQHNLAADGLVYPPDHPYWQHVPDEVLSAANGNNPFLYEKIYKGKKGGYVYDNPLHKHSKKQGWTDEQDIASFLADQGERIILLPEIEADSKAQKALRKMTLPRKTDATKSPDAWLPVHKSTLELKSVAGSKSSIDNALHDAGKKAAFVCLNIKKARMTLKQTKAAIKGRVMQSGNIKEVWVILPGSKKPVKYTRDEILKF